MDNPVQVDLGRIAQDLQIRRVQVESVVHLLDEGNTVPFITRYRKERTGNLNEVTIHEIQLRVQRLRELAERKETILKAIEAQGKLMPDLATAIKAADNPKRLEDLYLPFKPKKRTKASDARDRGLEPLAVRVWNHDDTLTEFNAAAQEFLNAEKGVESVEKVVEGVGHILAEAISELAAVRDAVRKVVWKTGKIVASKGDLPEGQGLDYRDYFAFSESIAQIPPHRVLAINRGDKENALKVNLEVSRPDVEAALCSQLPLEGHPQAELFRTAAIDSLDRLILPSMECEVRRDLTDAAERHAVDVFARNLRSLLLQPPIAKQVVMAIDPGFRTGCKVAVLDQSGEMLEQAVVYPHAPQNRRSDAKHFLKNLVGKHHVGVVAIGNGTACRETEELVAEIIAEGTRFSQEEGAQVPSGECATIEPSAAHPVATAGDLVHASDHGEPGVEAVDPEAYDQSAAAAPESLDSTPVAAAGAAWDGGSLSEPVAAPPVEDLMTDVAPSLDAAAVPAETPGAGGGDPAAEPHSPPHAESTLEVLPPVAGGAPDAKLELPPICGGAPESSTPEVEVDESPAPCACRSQAGEPRRGL